MYFPVYLITVKVSRECSGFYHQWAKVYNKPGQEPRNNIDWKFYLFLWREMDKKWKQGIVAEDEQWKCCYCDFVWVSWIHWYRHWEYRVSYEWLLKWIERMQYVVKNEEKDKCIWTSVKWIVPYFTFKYNLCKPMI